MDLLHIYFYSEHISTVVWYSIEVLSIGIKGRSEAHIMFILLFGLGNWFMCIAMYVTELNF